MRTFRKRGLFRSRYAAVWVDGSVLVVGEGRTPDALASVREEHGDPVRARTAADAACDARLAAGFVETTASAGQPAAGPGGSAPAQPMPAAAPAPGTPAAASAAPQASASQTASASRPGYVPSAQVASLFPQAQPVAAPALDLGADVRTPERLAVVESLWAELGFEPTAVDRALAGWPAEAAPPAPLDPDAEHAWVLAHTRVRSYGGYLDFLAEPLDGPPSRDRAVWWNRFLLAPRQQGRDAASFRFAFADRIEEGPLPYPSVPLHDGSETALTATRVTLEGRDATAAALARTASSVGLAALVGLRGVVLPAGEGAVTAEVAVADVGGASAAQFALLWTALVSAPLGGSAEAARFALNADALPEQFWRAGPALASALLPERRSEVPQLVRAIAWDRLVRPWLGLTGAAGLQAVEDGIALTGRDDATLIAEQLAGAVHSAAAVPAMLRLTRDTRVGGVAGAWLAAHPAAIAASTEPVPPKLRGAHEAAVRAAFDADPSAFPDEVANPQTAQVLAQARAELDLPPLGEPAWWDEAVAAEAAEPTAPGTLVVPARVAPWARAALPALVVDDARVTDVDAVLLSAVRGANQESPRPLVAAVRERMSAGNRDRAGIALLSVFLGAGAKPRDRAWFMASGSLGADGYAEHLVPMLKGWPAQSQHQRAVLGLSALVATGTDGALAGIVEISMKAPSKGIQRAAGEAVERLAAQRGLTADQLADLVAPRGGLDEAGQRVLDYGSRRFRLSLSADGAPVLRDLDSDGRPTGRPRKTLPAPVVADDAERVADAKSALAQLRKALTESKRTMARRLERAMASGRSWTAAEHRATIVEHPVANALTRPLVWTVTDGDVRTLARITQEGEYLAADDEQLHPSDAAVVQLAHPLDLAPDEIDVWRAVLRENDLVAPVDQLDRAVYQRGSSRGALLGDLPEGGIEPRTLDSRLQRLGWIRADPADGGGFFSWYRLPLPAFGLAATLLADPGMYLGDVGGAGPQRIVGVRVGPLAQVAAAWEPTDDSGVEWVDWADADPRIVSEVRRSLAIAAEQ